MNIDFDQIIDRRSSDSIKWNRYPEDVLPLWVADMDFLSPQPVIDAMQTRLNQGIFGYPCKSAEASHAVITWLSNRHNWKVKQESLIFLPGIVPAFNLIAQALASPGDGLLFHTPAYKPFFSVASNAGLEEQQVPLSQSKSGKFIIDFDLLENCIQPHSRLFLLCNPQNPTGRVFTRPELKRIADICLENNLIICSDEIHCDLVFPGHNHIPIASLSKDTRASTITLIAPSKTFNIAGLKASVAVVQNQELRESILDSRRGLFSSLNIFGTTALTAAYLSGTPWLEALLDYLNENRYFLGTFVAENLPGISCYLPEGTFLAWLDCRSSGLDDPQGHFLREAKVALNPGTWFGKDGSGFVRLNFACPRAVLEEGLLRIRDSLPA